MTAASPAYRTALYRSNWPVNLSTLQGAALVLITFIAYQPVLKNHFIWDDDRYIEQNKWLKVPGGLSHIWLQYDSEPQYYPLTHTTFWIEHYLWGFDPSVYHLDNLVLQMASALLLWQLLTKLKIPGAWLAAALFAIHPVQVETVAWATERKNLLSGLFYFLALDAYLKSNLSPLSDAGRKAGDGAVGADQPFHTGGPERINLPWYFASLLLFVCALLSKSVTSTLPAVILLLIWWKRGFLRLRDVYPLIPFFVCGLSMGALTGWMEKNIVGAIGPEFSAITRLDRICIAGRVVWFYLWKLAVPIRLTFIYPHWNVAPNPTDWLYLFPASVVFLCVGLYLLRDRIGRGPLCAVLFFIGTMFPALGFVNVFPMRYSFVADHFQYLACIGPFVLFSAGVARTRVVGVKLEKVVPFLVIPLLGTLTHRQTFIYKDRMALWRDTVEKNPDSPMAHDNLGAALRDRGDLDAAEAEYRTATKLEPEKGDYIGIGQISAMRHDYKSAVGYYEKALANTPDSDIPFLQRRRAIPWFQIGTAYDGLAAQAEAAKLPSGEYRSAAMDAYHKALQYDPGNPDAALNLAADYLALGDTSGAIAQAQAVLDNDSTSEPALNLLGAAYARRSSFGQASGYYESALEIDPADVEALMGVGSIRALHGDFAEAQRYFEAVLKLEPDNSLAKLNLNVVLANKSGVK